MSDTTDADRQVRTSAAAVLRSAAVALAAAALATAVFVLPAEFGIDPTGLGARLGLLQLARTELLEPVAAAPLGAGSYPAVPATFDFFDPEVLGEPYSKAQASAFRSDTLEIPLDSGEQVEVKAVMRRGDALVYSWRADGGTVYADFHADPGPAATGYPDRYFIRYRESESAESAGSLVAPFDGNHGWYWLNIEEHPVTIRLELSGYYEQVGEILRSYD